MKGKIIGEMVKGYGPDFPGPNYMFDLKPSSGDLARLSSLAAGPGRYEKHVKFLENVTSGKAIGIKRFKVITEYLIALNDFFSNEYDGEYRKIIHGLTKEQKRIIRSFGTTEGDIVQAEFLEKFTEHDTAAAGDYVKFEFALMFPRLEKFIEAVYFNTTSEDIMGNVFGMICNELVYDHLIPRIADFGLQHIKYTNQSMQEGIKIIPAETHQQSAEVTLPSQKAVVRESAINEHIKDLVKEDSYYAFSGKFGGAIGTLSNFYATYPDVNWEEFAQKFVTSFGLQYQRYTDQCVSYAVEVKIFSAVVNILNEIVKIAKDFLEMASSPAQLFVKRKKAGTKASSLMPNKSNAWMVEGGIEMLLKGINNLRFLIERLPQYPLEGNMGRSFLMRDIGNDFSPIFIGLNRIEEEMFSKYYPSAENIKTFLDRYPGMAGSVLQSVLKRQRIQGDAYRIIQGVSINPDGTYANKEQFNENLALALDKLKISAKNREEIMHVIKFENIVKPAERISNEGLAELSDQFNRYKEWLRILRGNHRSGEAGKMFKV